MTYEIIEYFRQDPPDEIIGKQFTEVYQSELVCDEAIFFIGPDNVGYALGHQNCCCESFQFEEIHGDLDDLIGTPIIEFYLSESNNEESEYGSDTWSFYVARTMKGTVTFRCHGASNGYYSEDADWFKVKRNSVN